MLKVFFIDPNSYNNLGVYDYSLLKGINDIDLYFFGSYLYNCPDVGRFIPLFTYNKQRNNLKKGLSYCASLYKLMAYIRKVRPDIVHIQWLRFLPVDIRLLNWMRKQGCKVILTAHNILPHDTGDRYQAQYARYYDMVDHIIVHTEKSKRELKESFGINPNKISVIYHGVYDYGINESNISRSMQRISAEYQLQGKTVFGMYGKHFFYKGTDIVADVWTKTPELRDNPDCVLILGDKNSYVNYHELKTIPNVIIVEKRFPDDDFNAVLRLTSVMLLPYRDISQSGLLFSAIANSTPVLVSNAGGLADPLKIAKIGWNIGTSSFENLQKALKELVMNTKEITAVKNDHNAFRKVQAAFDWEEIACQTEKLYRSL